MRGGSLREGVKDIQGGGSLIFTGLSTLNSGWGGSVPPIGGGPKGGDKGPMGGIRA